MAINWHIQTYDCVDSTQDTLKASLLDTSSMISEGYVVRAIKQLRGRGRHGRQWEEGTGNLYFSFLLCPHIDARNIGHISLLCGVSLQDMIISLLEDKLDIIIKWPNDILIDQKKCAGILIETLDVSPSGIIKNVVVGIGINVSYSPIEVSCCLSDYRQLSPESVLEAFLKSFDHHYNRYQSLGFEPIRDLWLKNSFSVGQVVSVKLDQETIKGQFETVDQSGNLVLCCDQTKEMITIHSGDVFLS